MFNIPNPIAPLLQTQIELARQYADVLFSEMERMNHIVLDAARHAFDEQLQLPHSLTGPQEPGPDWNGNIQPNLLSAAPNMLFHFQNRFLRAMAGMQNEVANAMKTRFEQGADAAKEVSARGDEAAEAARVSQAAGTVVPTEKFFNIWSSLYKDLAQAAASNMTAGRPASENAAEDTSARAPEKKMQKSTDKRISKTRDRKTSRVNSRAH